jgi:hypothetical protein
MMLAGTEPQVLVATRPVDFQKCGNSVISAAAAASTNAVLVMTLVRTTALLTHLSILVMALQ